MHDADDGRLWIFKNHLRSVPSALPIHYQLNSPLLFAFKAHAAFVLSALFSVSFDHKFYSFISQPLYMVDIPHT